MDEITTQTKTLILEKVVQSMIDGKKQKDACAEHGINVRTFQREVQNFPNIVSMVIDMNRKAIRERYQRVIDKRLELVDIILDEADDSQDLKLKTVLTLERRLHDFQVEFEGKVEIKDLGSVDHDALAVAAASYLSNLPALKRASADIIDVTPDKLE